MKKITDFFTNLLIGICVIFIIGYSMIRGAYAKMIGKRYSVLDDEIK